MSKLSTQAADKEIEAISVCVQVLMQIDKDARERVVEYLERRFGVIANIDDEDDEA